MRGQVVEKEYIRDEGYISPFLSSSNWSSSARLVFDHRAKIIYRKMDRIYFGSAQMRDHKGRQKLRQTLEASSTLTDRLPNMPSPVGGPKFSGRYRPRWSLTLSPSLGNPIHAKATGWKEQARGSGLGVDWKMSIQVHADRIGFSISKDP